MPALHALNACRGAVRNTKGHEKALGCVFVLFVATNAGRGTHDVREFEVVVTPSEFDP